MSEIVDMLNRIDAPHSIVLYNSIGLLGNIECEVDAFSNILEIPSWSKEETTKRGDYFNVICEDGCLLFDLYINKCGILFKDNLVYGYVFILKDYRALDDDIMFINEKLTQPAVVVYIDNKLYTNQILDIEDKHGFIYDKNLHYKEMHSGCSILTVNNMIFNSCCIDIKNNIYRYYPSKLKL